MRSSRGNNLIAKSDDLQPRKRGQSVLFFSFNFFKKVPQKYRGSTAVLLIWKYRYRYRGTNFSKVPSTGTAVLLQSTVPTYGPSLQKVDVEELMIVYWNVAARFPWSVVEWIERLLLKR